MSGYCPDCGNTICLCGAVCESDTGREGPTRDHESTIARLTAERDEAVRQRDAALDDRAKAWAQRDRVLSVLERATTLARSWADGDEPEGAPSPRRALLALCEVLGVRT
jgi:hypothetical protein